MNPHWWPPIKLLCVPVLEVELTRLLDKQGVDQFDIFDPEVLPQDVSLSVHRRGFCLTSVDEEFILFALLSCRALWLLRWTSASLITF